jgi:ATPase family associated with various cellular activities (AAA)
MADPPADGEAREFAAAFRRFLEWVHSAAAGVEDDSEVAALVQEILGPDGVSQSVVTRELAAFEHVNLQTALDAWSVAPGRTVEVRGLAIPPHYGGVSLQQLVVGAALPPLRFSAPSLVDLANGPGSTLGCLRLALLLVTDEHGRYVVLVQGPGEHQQILTVEIAGLPVGAAQLLLAELEELRNRLNVYRGHLLDASIGPMGSLDLTFVEPPGIGRADIVLPERILARVERHALAVARHRDALLASRQHLKRGILLYGPPGTGKTHTTRYLLGQMTDYTRVVLAGRALHAVGPVADLARDLHPAVVVIEDVDLVAEDRSHGPASSPILFDLLDAMDGGDPDADLLFLLTTNRADLLEPALAARPGRVDVAVEIPLPEPAARRQLFALYARTVELAVTDADIDTAVERTEGVTASFLKELVRRSVLESLEDTGFPTVVTGTHLSRALDDLLDAAQAVTRTLLGVGVDPAEQPAGLTPAPGPGWVGPAGPRPARYYSR